jgi:tRNA G18 (ribose-2'-O)-methylase SpoU
LPQVISGINAVKENLKEGKKGIVELLIARGRKSERVREILGMAREKRIPVRFKDRLYLDKISSVVKKRDFCLLRIILLISGTLGLLSEPLNFLEFRVLFCQKTGLPL